MAWEVVPDADSRQLGGEYYESFVIKNVRGQETEAIRKTYPHLPEFGALDQLADVVIPMSVGSSTRNSASPFMD